MVAPFAGVSGAIAESAASFAIVDDAAAPFAQDLVVNQPDLSNRPIRLLASVLQAPDLPSLCARGSIAFFNAPALKPVADFFGEHQNPTSQHVLDLEAGGTAHSLRHRSCQIASMAARSTEAMTAFIPSHHQLH